MYGRAGLHWVRALLGGSARRAAVAAYARYAQECADVEFISGFAGVLTGACLLLEQFEDMRLRNLVSALVTRLSQAVRARDQTWQPIDATGFAHHWPGVIFALLAATKTSGEPPAAC